jgi:hypothetical protein
MSSYYKSRKKISGQQRNQKGPKLSSYRNHDADSDRRADEDDRKTPVDVLEGGLQSLSWVGSYVKTKRFSVRNPSLRRLIGYGGLTFSGQHGNVLGTGDDEGCLEKTTEESLESAEGAASHVLSKSTLSKYVRKSFTFFSFGRDVCYRIVPVAEAVGVVLWVTADHGHEGKAENDKDKKNL